MFRIVTTLTPKYYNNSTLQEPHLKLTLAKRYTRKTFTIAMTTLTKDPSIGLFSFYITINISAHGQVNSKINCIIVIRSPWKHVSFSPNPGTE